MKKLFIILVCLIAFMPKELFLQNPEAWIQVFSEIYREKHPGTKAIVKVGETKSGLIRVEIDTPKVEL